MAGARVTLNTRKLDAILNGAGPGADRILDKAAKDVEAHWKEYIIVKDAIDTSAYLNGIHVRADHKFMERVISYSVEYGHFVELGTTRMPARPCAYPAVEDVKPGFYKAFEELFR